jgi:hypothetical protein
MNSENSKMKPEEQPEVRGLSATDWEPLFRKAGVEVEKLDSKKSKHAKATIIGNWLARNADREVAVTIGKRTGKARLRILDGRSKRRCYVFEIHWDEPEEAESQDDPDLRRPEEIPGSATAPSTEEKVKVKKAKRKAPKATKEKRGVTDKSAKRTPATNKGKKGVAKKKASPSKKSAGAENTTSIKRLANPDQRRGNAESW